MNSVAEPNIAFDDEAGGHAGQHHCRGNKGNETREVDLAASYPASLHTRIDATKPTFR